MIANVKEIIINNNNINDLIKPILYVSGVRLLNLVYTPLKVFIL